MGHVFSYPVVKEIRSSAPPGPGTQARAPRPWATTQRNLVQASLLRCPEPGRADGRRS
jgi:hypothetical protein